LPIYLVVFAAPNHLLGALAGRVEDIMARRHDLGKLNVSRIATKHELASRQKRQKRREKKQERELTPAAATQSRLECPRQIEAKGSSKSPWDKLLQHHL
jgi:hypothetical protein